MNYKEYTNKAKKIAVCALIYDSNYRILSVSRKNNMSDFGLIGGKLEENETLTEGLIREIKEETGLDVIKHTLVWEHDDNDFYVYTFLVKCEGKINSQETGLVRWLFESEINILLEGSFGTYNRKLFEYLIDNYKDFDFNFYISNIILK